MARLTGVNPAVVRTMVSNRFRPDFAESVSVQVQGGLVVVDVSDCGFDEAVRRAWRAQLTAGKYGYYDPRRLWDLMERMKQERGAEVDLMLYFNDGRRGTALPGGPSSDGEAPPTEEAMWDALAETRFEWGTRSNLPDAKAYLDVLPSTDTVRLSLRIDTAAVTPGEGLRIARGVEEVLLAAAFDGEVSTGV